MLRPDLSYLYAWVKRNSRVLDLGCGSGELLEALSKEKGCLSYGVEIDIAKTLQAMKKGISILQLDIENDFSIFKENQFDIVILSQTLQAMRNPELILQEMLRLAEEAIVSFPNFGYWRNRLQLSLGGKMPISENMPYSWFETPNIHWCTIEDFESLCKKNTIQILDKIVLTQGKSIAYWPNLLGSLAVYRLGRGMKYNG
ncbi:MAG: methionine biosynthesis protein MetW [Neisseriaceae bacterium]